MNGELHWLHVATTATHVHDSVHEKRGTLAMDAAGILPDFTGVAVHDHWKPYWHYPCQHALCNAHHLRELRYCEQLTGDDWAIALRLLLVEGKKAIADAKAEGKTALPTETIADLLHRYDQLATSDSPPFQYALTKQDTKDAPRNSPPPTLYD